MTQKDIVNGLIAGFVSTLVLAVLMLGKSFLGILPELRAIDLVQVLSNMNPIIAAWIGHFIIGTILWGGIFVWLYPLLPSNLPWVKGVVFGIGAWFFMMAVVMPFAGVGFFGLNDGVVVPAATLGMHVIFGFVLGFVYGTRSSI